MAEQEHTVDLDAVQKRLVQVTKDLQQELDSTDLSTWSHDDCSKHRKTLWAHIADLDKLKRDRQEADMFPMEHNVLIEFEKIKVDKMIGKVSEREWSAYCEERKAEEDAEEAEEAEEARRAEMEGEPERGRTRYRHLDGGR